MIVLAGPLQSVTSLTEVESHVAVVVGVGVAYKMPCRVCYNNRMPPTGNRRGRGGRHSQQALNIQQWQQHYGFRKLFG